MAADEGLPAAVPDRHLMAIVAGCSGIPTAGRAQALGDGSVVRPYRRKLQLR